MRALPPRNATLPPNSIFEWRHATCWISTSQARNDYMRRLAVAPCGTVLLVYANAAYQFLTLSDCHVRSLAGGNKRSPTLGIGAVRHRFRPRSAKFVIVRRAQRSLPVAHCRSRFVPRLTNWAHVRISLGEPNNPTKNSLSLRLTARQRGFAGNSQYCGKAPLSSLPGLPVGLPNGHRPGLSEVRVSESPPRGARLVDCAGVRFSSPPYRKAPN